MPLVPEPWLRVQTKIHLSLAQLSDLTLCLTLSDVAFLPQPLTNCKAAITEVADIYWCLFVNILTPCLLCQNNLHCMGWPSTAWLYGKVWREKQQGRANVEALVRAEGVLDQRFSKGKLHWLLISSQPIHSVFAHTCGPILCPSRHSEVSVAFVVTLFKQKYSCRCNLDTSKSCWLKCYSMLLFLSRC